MMLLCALPYNVANKYQLVLFSIYKFDSKLACPTCLAPKRRVDRLSDAFEELGEQQHKSAVLEFPPCLNQRRLSFMFPKRS